MLRKPIRLLAQLFALVLTACGQDLTSSSATPSLALGATPDIQNVWETWNITEYVVCGSHTFVNGTIDMHLVTQTKVNSDGVVSVTQHFNGHGRLTEANGSESVYSVHGDFTQVAQSGGSYQVFTTNASQLITKGVAINEFIVADVSIGFDPVTGFTIVSKIAVRCVGRGAVP
jgi:hypothetical protein